ncbi:MAG TPA: NAD-dependent epimerase/dehydratase family protein [Actinomycetota bacterium]|nr:NAD-dependent epimerase/dehydratase family protein [Actinomycetota bacterium]
MAQRILITGISRHLAAKLAQRLERDPEVESIVGVDLEEPEVDLERTEFVRADIRNPLIVKVIQASEADTLVHLNIITTPTRVGGRSVMKEINVIGSLQLFAACQKVTALRKVVMKSTTAVYGAGPNDPAVFTEEMAMRSPPSSGYARDAMEVEQYARDYGRRRRGGVLTILRFANFMGSEIETPLTRYFSLPVVPTPLGFDPRIQFVHEDDAVEVLYRATRDDHPGMFNVAADGVLLLSQAVRICGKPSLPVPVPIATPLTTAMRRLGLIDFPADQLQFLVYGRVADNQRLKTEFGLSPTLTTRQALEEFMTGQRLRRLFTRERAERWERDVYEFLLRTGPERAAARRGRGSR